jgi:hypothetical protein
MNSTTKSQPLMKNLKPDIPPKQKPPISSIPIYPMLTYMTRST